LNNQQVLIGALSLMHLDPATVLFDGHAILETSEGVLPLPSEVFNALSPLGMVAVFEDAVVLSERRRAGELTAEPENLAAMQDFEIQHASAQAERLGIPFLMLQSGDAERLVRFAEDLLHA
jgi:adenylate kinase